MTKRNPDASAVLQVLLDIADAGYSTMRIDQLITKMRNDPPALKDLEAKWHAHQYPSRRITFAKLAIDQHLMTLSDTAVKVLVCLGMYCGQSGLIQVSKADISKLTGIKRTSTATALKELIKCGAIAVQSKSVRHSASIYAVNPSLLKTGRKMVRDRAEYSALVHIPEADYIMARPLPLLVHSETITDGYQTYQRITLEQSGKA